MSDTTLGPGRSADAVVLAQEVTRQLTAIEHATEIMLATVDGLDDLSVRQPSLLDGWSRAHVITHLARNADGCTNLLIWARTGIEHPMYASGDDRDEAIAEGAVRGHRLLAEDLAASAERFASSARALPPQAWAAEMQPRAAQQGVTVELEGHTTGVPLAFHASTLRRAVLNVVQNAIEAMPDGGTLRLECAATATEVQLRIRDSGVGMSAERVPQIFEPLFTTKPGGTGLGLYIVREILVAHRGGVTVDSVEGQGTTFILTFPMPG